MTARILKAMPLGILVGLLGLVISFVPFFHELEEDTGLGLLFTLRGARPAPSDAVVVSIDAESSEHLNIPNNPDKWPRSLHARLIEKLTKEGAKAVTFDVHFLEPRAQESDEQFAAALSRAGNVIIADALTAKEVASSDNTSAYASELNIVKIVKPYEPFAQAAVATAPFVLPRIPFKVNQYWAFQTEAGNMPTFPMVTLQLLGAEVYGEFIRVLEKVSPAHAGKLPRDMDATIKRKGIQQLIIDLREVFEGDPSLADGMRKELAHTYSQSADDKRYALLRSLVDLYGGSSRRYLNYYGPPRTVTTIPYYRALQLGEGTGNAPSFDLTGKAVFVGLSEKLLAERKDSFYTVYSQANGVFISGVEIAATAFLNMLEDGAVKPIGPLYYILIVLAWGLLIGICCRVSSIIVGATAALAVSVLYLVVAEYQFQASGVWYPIVIPLFLQSPLGLFGAVVWSYVETNKERQHIRKALAYYVPDEVVDQLAKNILDIKSSGQEVYGACLFADVAGYTTLSEKLTPQQLSELMHKYFEATFEPVKKHGGLVVNLKGDSFLAIWKAARAEEGLRRQACLAALDVAKAVHRFNDSYDNLNLPTRVGVHSGQIFLGNIGAGDHYEYGPTGDTVNTASRMDGLNKYLGTEVLASEEIVDQIHGVLKREVGKFKLKGKAQPIVVYELLGSLDQADERTKRCCEMFANALATFRSQSWQDAEQQFRDLLTYSDTDGPAQFYLARCEEYKTNPPEGGWDGIISLEEK
jgi:adenylate cyclase